MGFSVRRVVFGAALFVVATAVAGVAWSEDKEAELKNRQATMKSFGPNLQAVKEYIEDKGDQAKATAGATAIVETVKKIPTLFPAGTGMAEFPGKSGAKPVVWSDWNKFVDAQKNALAKADALLVAVKGGDKTAVTAAFGDLGKNGCGGCHSTFREKI
jgi:cytochrome c556